jgi:hypothetical protein
VRELREGGERGRAAVHLLVVWGMGSKKEIERDAK